jgi:hypothetical protein
MAQITDKVLNESDVPEALQLEAVAHAWFGQQVLGSG